MSDEAQSAVELSGTKRGAVLGHLNSEKVVTRLDATVRARTAVSSRTVNAMRERRRAQARVARLNENIIGQYTTGYHYIYILRGQEDQEATSAMVHLIEPIKS